MQTANTKIKNLNIIKHPVIGENLAILRDKNQSFQYFRLAAKKITQILMYEASKNLPTMEKEVQTPLETTVTNVISDGIEIIVSPILRAGLVFEETVLELMPMAKIFHIGMYRNEETLKPVWYYNKLPEKLNCPEKTFVYITDPMLATGGSLYDAINLFIQKNVPPSQIKAVCIISAPEGIEHIHSQFSDVEIISAALDRSLNEKGYILPGLGDAGDRIFNTL
ncbi:MAG: uracil phosphoribosyltransferase [bacterium]|nr:uracil phosphoribosyltransferase [bacterium]